MIKTTRLKPTQVPKNITFDLTDQVDGERQTFTLPQKCYDIDTHYVLFNGQVYRNDDNATYYSISDDGMTLTTYFDTPPLPGVSHVLQFVKTDDTEAEGNVATESYVDNAVSVLQGEIDTIVAASDVRDIVGTHADLEAYDTSTLGDNDIIKVLVDETQDDKTSYYRWSTSTEEFTLIGTLGPFQGLLTAGANITIDANNEISAIDTTYDAFVGTDGVDAGSAGLVPAPATTDAGKFLKADGTWDTAGSSITLYTTYGQNTDGAMTQKATTDLVYTAGDPKKINIGDNGVAGATNSIIIGSEDSGTITAATDQVIIGHNVTVPGQDTIAIGHTLTTRGATAICIGTSSEAGPEGTAIGHTAKASRGTNSNAESVAIGHNASASGYACVAVGNAAKAQDSSCVAIGKDAQANKSENVAVGTSAKATNGTANNAFGDQSQATSSDGGALAVGFGAMAWTKGGVAIGATSKTMSGRNGVVSVGNCDDDTRYCYGGTLYRIIEGVHDGVQLHDAATVAQGNTLATSAPTTTTTGVLGQLYTDTTAMHTYQCTAINTTDPANPVYTWTQRW